MNEDEIKKIAAELKNEFGIPVEISDSGDDRSDRWCFYRLADEYGKGKGKPKQLLNRAIKGEVLGGEIVLNLKVWIVNQLKNPQTSASTRKFCEDMLETLENIRNEMADEILRRYKNPAGKDSLIALFQKLKSMLPLANESATQETILFVRNEVFSALEDIVC